MTGLSNIELEHFIKNDTSTELKKKFKKVISSNSLTKYVDFKSVLKENNPKYATIIMNTARVNTNGVHWWSIVNIEPKKHVFLFDSYGFKGFRVFILRDNKQVIDKILYNLKKKDVHIKKKDACEKKNLSDEKKSWLSNKKIELLEITFNVSAYQKLTFAERESISSEAHDLFNLLTGYAAVKNQTEELFLIIVETQLQDEKSSTCGNFNLYFLKHLFDPLKTSDVIDCKKLNEKTLEILFSEIFSSDIEENEKKVKIFSENFNIKHTG